MTQKLDDLTRQLFETGQFENPLRTGCRAVSVDGTVFDWPYTFDEWNVYNLKLWDMLHEVANGTRHPNWSDLRFRDESDYFCNSFQKSLNIWLMAVNALNSDKLKYHAYSRIFDGVDLFDTIDHVPKTNPRGKLCTVKLPHSHNRRILKKMGKTTATRICGVSVYPNCRTPRLLINDTLRPAIMKNGDSVIENKEFIIKQIKKWVKSGAISCVGKVNGEKDRKNQCKQFFSASIFVVCTSKERLIFNGHPIKILERFKKSCVLDAVPDVLKIVKKNDILLKFDDSSGFHQLPLQRFSRNLASFRFGDFRFRFNCSPFGLPTIPHHFQATNSVAVNYVRKLGFKVFLYLDDRLTINKLPENNYAPKAAWLMCATQIALGGFINRAKSTFENLTEIEFLGFILNTKNETIKIPEDKWEKFCKEGSYILSKEKITPKLLEKFRGKCASFSIVAPMMRLYIRNMTRFISEADQGIGVIDNEKTLTEDIKEEINKWINKKSITTVRKWQNLTYDRVKLISTLSERTAEITIATDASNFAGGIVTDTSLGNGSTTFYWKNEELLEPIHIKEALALLYALEQNRTSLSGKSVLLECDNMGVVKTFQFGSKNKRLNDIITKCHEVAIDNNFRLQIIWVPTLEQKADEPSRTLTTAEAELNEWGFNKLKETVSWEFTLDGMATRFNTKCKKFLSRDYDADALETNFFGFKTFSNHITYIFPPGPILTDTYNHLDRYAQNARWCLILRLGSLFPSWWGEVINNEKCFLLEIGNEENQVILNPSKEGLVSCRKPVKTWALFHSPHGWTNNCIKSLYY